jgi:hypothetical protein
MMAAHVSDRPRIVLGGWALLAMIVWPFALCAVNNYLFRGQIRTVAQDLEKSNPPIAVVDTTSIIKATPRAQGDDPYKPGYQRARRIVGELKAKGYIVLDASTVLEAPKRVVVAAK